MLDVIDLDFDYQDGPLLQKVTFHIPSGGLLHLRGANGVGKTTLMKLIAGLYQPVSGSILFLKHNIANNSPEFQKNICYVGHKTGISPYLSLNENCQSDLHFNEKTTDLNTLASIFKLEHASNIPCGLLSAGQKRQIGLLRLWMTQAKLWLLDEPLVALDEHALELVIEKINLHRQQGGAVLLTSHQPLPSSCFNYQEYSL